MAAQITITQGDNATLQLTAQDGNGNPVNISGATFSTQIMGANGSGTVVFGNAQHTITNAALGQFILALAQADTANCGLGSGKDILTAVTISGSVTYFRGAGILTVNPAVPFA